jgi:release factor glutamine methyltransferase
MARTGRAKGECLTVGGALREALVRLASASPTPQLDAALLTAHALGLERTKLLSSRDEPIDDEAALKLDALIIQRELGVPVAYLLGAAGFYGREFEVTPAVLIPRPETEHLVEAALEALRARAPEEQRVWDAGTGSGAIAITIAAELPSASIAATDVSDEALRIARRNAAKHGIDRVTFSEGNLTGAFHEKPAFNVVVANLPYVPTAEIPEPPDPAGYEPFTALDGGPDGLAVYRNFIAAVPSVLARNAVIFAEAAPPTIPGLTGLFRNAFPNAVIEIHRDHARLERFLSVAVG